MRISEAPEASMISFDDYGVNRRVFVVVDGRRFYFDPEKLSEECIFDLDKECKIEYTLSWVEYQNLKMNIRNMNSVGGIFVLLGIVAFFTVFIVLASK